MTDEINYFKLGEKIKSARERKNLTQEQLAELCQLSAAHIGHIERGTRTPSLETIFRVAVSLGVSVDFLLLDSQPDKTRTLAFLDGILAKAEPQKARRFITVVKAVADKIDEL